MQLPQWITEQAAEYQQQKQEEQSQRERQEQEKRERNYLEIRQRTCEVFQNAGFQFALEDVQIMQYDNHRLRGAGVKFGPLYVYLQMAEYTESAGGLYTKNFLFALDLPAHDLEIENDVFFNWKRYVDVPTVRDGILTTDPDVTGKVASKIVSLTEGYEKAILEYEAYIQRLENKHSTSAAEDLPESRFIEVGNRIINLDNVTYVERPLQTLFIHFNVEHSHEDDPHYIVIEQPLADAVYDWFTDQSIAHFYDE